MSELQHENSLKQAILAGDIKQVHGIISKHPLLLQATWNNARVEDEHFSLGNTAFLAALSANQGPIALYILQQMNHHNIQVTTRNSIGIDPWDMILMFHPEQGSTTTDNMQAIQEIMKQCQPFIQKSLQTHIPDQNVSSLGFRIFRDGVMEDNNTMPRILAKLLLSPQYTSQRFTSTLFKPGEITRLMFDCIVSEKNNVDVLSLLLCIAKQHYPREYDNVRAWCATAIPIAQDKSIATKSKQLPALTQLPEAALALDTYSQDLLEYVKPSSQEQIIKHLSVCQEHTSSNTQNACAVLLSTISRDSAPPAPSHAAPPPSHAPAAYPAPPPVWPPHAAPPPAWPHHAAPPRSTTPPRAVAPPAYAPPAPPPQFSRSAPPPSASPAAPPPPAWAPHAAPAAPPPSSRTYDSILEESEQAEVVRLVTKLINIHQDAIETIMQIATNTDLSDADKIAALRGLEQDDRQQPRQSL